MKYLLPLLLLLSSKTWSKFEKDFSGNIEGQARHSWNNDMAKDDLGQDWDETDFYLFYGNINAKFDFDHSRVETNLFGRYSKSELYEDPDSPFQPPNVAPLIWTFPNKLVARDLFKLSHDKTGDDYRTEYVLNKLYYEFSYEENRFMFGRMYINYGQGEIFNPINPFNQPTGLTSISQVAQGNDGFNFTFYANEKHTIDFYFLGDKSFDGYDGTIEKTIWIHGEYQFNDTLQFDYVGGQDQKRNKIGGQLRKNFEEAMVFTQIFYQSAYYDHDDDDKSESLWDFTLAYDQQLTNKWHLRGEGGYQEKNDYAGLGNINERFLPTEYFIALANQYEVHPLVKLGGTFVFDIKSGFTYFITRNTIDLGHDIEADLFGYIPVAKGDDIENPAQKLVTTDVGVALRAFF